jgi:hypothetical protein
MTQKLNFLIVTVLLKFQYIFVISIIIHLDLKLTMFIIFSAIMLSYFIIDGISHSYSYFIFMACKGIVRILCQID